MNAEAHARLDAALEGRYRIERELGEGGMGTVGSWARRRPRSITEMCGTCAAAR